ncbi:MAG: hypothetical protein II479_01375 [Bacteroidales bacterium]|nr:hypothetical protein [Bacteroidales bacterium]
MYCSDNEAPARGKYVAPLTRESVIRYELSCLALVALVLGACQKETDKNTPPAAGKACLPEIVAEVEQAQTSQSTVSVDENGTGTILWQPYDAINVFFGTKGAVYVSQNTRNAASAPFRTTDAELESDNIWGLYPYDRNAACDGASVTTTLPGHQYGVPGTFADDLFITLAHSATNTLKFFNVCCGIKFSLTPLSGESLTLTSIDLPEGLKRIGNRAFEYCTSLDEVQCKPATPPGGGTYMFYYASDCPIYVPSASVEAYKDAKNWSIYASRIQAMP